MTTISKQKRGTSAQLPTSRETLPGPAEVAAHLGTTVGQLANLRYRGTGPKFVVVGGRSIRYRWADVDEWLDANTRAQTGG